MGTFGTLLATHDGGKSWESWIERADNPDRLHFYSVYGIGGDVWASSERGVIFKLNREKRRFERMQTDYTGGFFGLVQAADGVIAYGLRGNAWRTRDGGKTWSKLDTGLQVGINGAAPLPDGRVVFVTQDGRLLLMAGDGNAFKRILASRPTLLTGVVAVGDHVVLSGFNGVQVEALH